ncbi:MAG: hypothetical protein ACP5N1_05840 [Candidatus Woesearchaeota archaeon]
MDIDDILDKREFQSLDYFSNSEFRNIDDILDKREFRSLDYFLNREFRKNAGSELYKKMIEVFGSYKRARNYFYAKSIALGNKRPYDYCLNDDPAPIFGELGRIEHGVFS